MKTILSPSDSRQIIFHCQEELLIKTMTKRGKEIIKHFDELQYRFYFQNSSILIHKNKMGLVIQSEK